MTFLEKPPFWRAVVVVMLATLALVGFWPSPVDAPAQGNIADALDLLHTLGIPTWIDYPLVEKSANVVLFIPFGIAVVLAYPEKLWWHNSALGLAVSGCMELGQLIFLPYRFSSMTDVVTNTGGCVAGALLGVAVLRHCQKGRLPAQARSVTGPTPNSARPAAERIRELVD